MNTSNREQYRFNARELYLIAKAIKKQLRIQEKKLLKVLINGDESLEQCAKMAEEVTELKELAKVFKKEYLAQCLHDAL